MGELTNMPHGTPDPISGVDAARATTAPPDHLVVPQTVHRQSLDRPTPAQRLAALRRRAD